MTENEKRAFIEKIRQLPPEEQERFYYMVLGAAFAARENNR